jgi:hypothetical protein
MHLCSPLLLPIKVLFGCSGMSLGTVPPAEAYTILAEQSCRKSSWSPFRNNRTQVRTARPFYLDGAIITTISIYVLISHANDIVIPSCKSILQELHYFGLQQIFLCTSDNNLSCWLAIALISTVSWAFFLVRIILRASVHSSVF